MIDEPVTPVTAPPEMSPGDVELLDIAQQLLRQVWVAGRHEVATALRTPDGAVHTGVHLEGSCRRSSICAEAVALGAARVGLPPDAPLTVESVVSVQVKPAGAFRIIAPCGVCRELLSDYSPQARVWLTAVVTTGPGQVPAADQITAVAAIDLLPDKTRRAW
ncbi:hypothetical protein JQS43_06055 [Natronosporangium hydrolyticum]|uniref:Cytidine deaminase n=1 Tax=Natronosporangium hydrolyticum TaxID=2811111 RepID=A0A895YDL1_9ACTN|nr:hypothetical protein [Natronosporangium hydrolyticum]QSB15894.1 hypothetical protein JQS43_06055 [Natronosporangium hydrolyticum]